MTKMTRFEKNPYDLNGISLVKSSIIKGESIRFQHQGKERRDQVAYINWKYSEFWKSYQPNQNARISVLINLGPYRFLISQSPTNLSKLFEFLDHESVSISNKKNTGDQISWSFKEFNDSNQETYQDWIDQGSIYSQSDFNFILTWLIHDIWIFPTEKTAMKPINQELKESSPDYKIWKLKIQIVNQQYHDQLTIIGTNDISFRRLTFSVNGSTLSRNYNWRNGPSQKKINIHNANWMCPEKIYTYSGYCGCKKKNRSNRPKLSENYWYSKSTKNLFRDYLMDKSNMSNDQLIWQTKIKFINTEYHLKFKSNNKDTLTLNYKLYPNGIIYVNDRILMQSKPIPGFTYPIFNIYTGEISGPLPKLYQYSIETDNSILSKIKRLIDF